MALLLLLGVGLGLWAAPSWISAPLAWVLLGYLLTRAWPAVREDLAGVSRRGAPSIRRGRRKGAFL